MTSTSDGRTGWFRRAWQTLLAWEEWMSTSPAEYALDRVGALECEVSKLRDEVSWLRADSKTSAARTKIFHS